MKLKDDILQASKVRGINPYTQSFKPSKLGLKASDYGSFSDFCSSNETISGKWNKAVVLEVAEWTQTHKPFRYLLK